MPHFQAGHCRDYEGHLGLGEGNSGASQAQHRKHVKSI